MKKRLHESAHGPERAARSCAGERRGASGHTPIRSGPNYLRDGTADGRQGVEIMAAAARCALRGICATSLGRDWQELVDRAVHASPLRRCASLRCESQSSCPGAVSEICQSPSKTGAVRCPSSASEVARVETHDCLSTLPWAACPWVSPWSRRRAILPASRPGRPLALCSYRSKQ